MYKWNSFKISQVQNHLKCLRSPQKMCFILQIFCAHGELCIHLQKYWNIVIISTLFIWFPSLVLHLLKKKNNGREMQNYCKQMQKHRNIFYHRHGALKDWPTNTDYFCKLYYVFDMIFVLCIFAQRNYIFTGLQYFNKTIIFIKNI